MDESFEYLWSLMPMKYLEIEKGKGDLIEGYFRGLDRGDRQH